jgi:hypothetical protein
VDGVLGVVAVCTSFRLALALFTATRCAAVALADAPAAAPPPPCSVAPPCSQYAIAGPHHHPPGSGASLEPLPCRRLATASRRRLTTASHSTPCTRPPTPACRPTCLFRVTHASSVSCTCLVPCTCQPRIPRLYVCGVRALHVCLAASMVYVASTMFRGLHLCYTSGVAARLVWLCKHIYVWVCATRFCVGVSHTPLTRYPRISLLCTCLTCLARVWVYVRSRVSPVLRVPLWPRTLLPAYNSRGCDKGDVPSLGAHPRGTYHWTSSRCLHAEVPR